jgi:hypothetical protein
MTTPITFDPPEGRAVRLRVGLQHLKEYRRHQARANELGAAATKLYLDNACIREHERLRREEAAANESAQREASTAALFIAPALEGGSEDSNG